MTVTTTYQTFAFSFVPSLTNQAGETKSQLAYYGTYGTGNKPYVRNVYLLLGSYYLPNSSVLNLTSSNNGVVDLYAVWK